MDVASWWDESLIISQENEWKGFLIRTRPNLRTENLYIVMDGVCISLVTADRIIIWWRGVDCVKRGGQWIRNQGEESVRKVEEGKTQGGVEGGIGGVYSECRGWGKTKGGVWGPIIWFMTAVKKRGKSLRERAIRKREVNKTEMYEKKAELQRKREQQSPELQPWLVPFPAYSRLVSLLHTPLSLALTSPLISAGGPTVAKPLNAPLHSSAAWLACRMHNHYIIIINVCACVGV